MGTKSALPFSPYTSPYEAFSIFMNALSDFKERLEAEFPSSIETEELNALLTTIHNQADEINQLKAELSVYKSEESNSKIAPSKSSAKKRQKTKQRLNK